jgi:hypothetical protein
MSFPVSDINILLGNLVEMAAIFLSIQFLSIYNIPKKFEIIFVDADGR